MSEEHPDVPPEHPHAPPEPGWRGARDREKELGDYLAGELSGPALKRFEERLERDPQLAAEARALGELADRLQRLSSAVWEVLGADGDPQVGESLGGSGRAWVPGARRPRLAWSRVRPATGTAALLAALAIGVGAGILIERTVGGPSSATGGQGPVVSLRALVPGLGDARVLARLEPHGRIVIDYRGMPRPPQGHYYEAWLMSSQTKLVAVGSFLPGDAGSGQLETELPAPASAYRYIDISLQRIAAGPAISHRSVMRAATAALLR